MFNILLLYNATQTFTNTVFEHVACLARYSRHHVFYCHQVDSMQFEVDLSRFEAVGIHYSIRLPYDQFAPSTIEALANYKGLKFLFIQDEYDHTQRAWYWIKRLGIQLVFTVVPEAGIERVYPREEFPDTRFVSVLTGYVPDELRDADNLPPPSQRQLLIGYRGRPLPIRYGKLGQEKVDVGRITRAYCDERDLNCDIAWSEESRIYGNGWYDFMTSCRSMLGSESGSNVFDWDGTLVKRIAAYRKEHPDAGDKDIYDRFVAGEEIDGLMNQVSPRVFESIAARTALVLFEGTYSGVVKPHEHFIPLKKDGSNLPEVVRLLQDGAYVDAMAERAYADVIASGRYSYRAFVGLVDDTVAEAHQQVVDQAARRERERRIAVNGQPSPITVHPVRAAPPAPPPPPISETPTPITLVPLRAKPPLRLPFVRLSLRPLAAQVRQRAWNTAARAWMKLPPDVRAKLGPRIKSLLRKG